jgi:hypothetical protein
VPTSHFCSADQALSGVRNFSTPLKAGPAGGLRPPSGPATTRRSPGNRPHPSLQVASIPAEQRHAIGSRSGMARPVALPPGLLDVLLGALLARRPLVIEAALGSPTTTRTPKPPKPSLDLVPHDGTPPLNRASTRRIPRLPCLSLGPVSTGLVQVVELMLAGPTSTPPPTPRPHRLDPVQHDAPSSHVRRR